jgi:hypothetical protein
MKAQSIYTLILTAQQDFYGKDGTVSRRDSPLPRAIELHAFAPLEVPPCE